MSKEQRLKALEEKHAPSEPVEIRITWFVNGKYWDDCPLTNPEAKEVDISDSDQIITVGYAEDWKDPNSSLV